MKASLKDVKALVFDVFESCTPGNVAGLGVSSRAR